MCSASAAPAAVSIATAICGGTLQMLLRHAETLAKLQVRLARCRFCFVGIMLMLIALLLKAKAEWATRILLALG
jgi:hypothetical protein